MADYKTECGSVPLSFMQLLASCIFGYHDLQGILHYRLNGLEASNDCTELTEFQDCDVSHINPERQIVENTFALDACNLLAWKIFSSSDPQFTDYEDCGEIPKTFIELLARTIVTYASHNRINAYIHTGACEAVTPLLNCVTNNIESERLLVANVFALDDCKSRMMIKFFANSSTMTDFHTSCAELPQTFYQLLARCIVKHSGHYYINTASVTGVCSDLHAFWTCANNHITPERALVENVFATDSCGNLALKIFNNTGAR
jgi:hypothetical protein